MTIETTTSEVTYNGDGSTTVFSPSWTILDDDDISVYIIDESDGSNTLQTKTTHYTVSIDATDKTFSVTMVTAPTADEKLFIKLNKSRTQEFDPAFGGSLSSQGIESAMDQLNRQIRSLEPDIKCSVRLPYGMDGELSDYPASGLLRIKSDLTGVEAVNLSGLSLTQAYDFSTLSALTSGTVDSAADRVLIYDFSTDTAKYIVPDELLSGVSGTTASNQGNSGVGVFKQKTSNDLEFKNINAGSSKVVISDDTGNSEIDIDVDSDKILEDSVSANGLLTRTASETFTNRSIAGGTGISVSDGDGVSGNPTVALNINGLTSESALEASDFVSGYDTSAGAARKFALSDIGPLADISSLSADASPDGAADYLMVWDSSASVNKKVLPNNLPGVGSGTLVKVAESGSTGAVSSVEINLDFSTYNSMYLDLYVSDMPSQLELTFSDDNGSTYESDYDWNSTRLGSGGLSFESGDNDLVIQVGPTSAYNQIWIRMELKEDVYSNLALYWSGLGMSSTGDLGTVLSGTAKVNATMSTSDKMKFEPDSGTFTIGSYTLWGRTD